MNNINEALDYDGLKYYHKKLKNMLSISKGIVFCEDDMERLAIVSPISETVYIVLSPLSIYIHDETWKCISSQQTISEEYIESLFTIDEVGELTNNITPISSNTIDNIWNSV